MKSLKDILSSHVINSTETVASQQNRTSVLVVMSGDLLPVSTTVGYSG